VEWNPEPRTMNETTNRPTNEHAYADVMEQPRHEPAPSMQSDFFTEAARGGSGSNPRYGGGTSGRASFSKPGTSTASLVSDVAQKKFGNARLSRRAGLSVAPMSPT